MRTRLSFRGGEGSLRARPLTYRPPRGPAAEADEGGWARVKPLAYPARIRYHRADRAYLVEFPDLPGCLTYGTTKAEALANAEEALSGYLASIFDRGFVLPRPSTFRGAVPVEPSLPVRTAILLRQLRTGLRLSQKEAARRLRTSYQAYQKLENPRRCNPTLKTLERLGRAFKTSLALEVRQKSRRAGKAGHAAYSIS
ncbi:MAG: type II toxin-antitoxin system HicB family antitoxin [Candidatus Rokubacteria bacterium]|nr:type II toxin-antitoxin system HicB family antitoxin [Candidatus Rokubacteria bacterium]